MDELLGDGHRAILARLLGQLRTLQAGDDQVPRVVLLTGPSGAGKSRVIREVYRSLQSAQRQPGYWPPLPESVPAAHGSAVDQALASRKVIGPPIDGFRWPPGALPSFTWWDFNCGQIRPVSPVDAVAHAAPAIDAHQLPALLAWRRTASVSERVGTLKDDAVDRIRETLAAGGSELAGLVLDSVGLAIPGWGLLFDWFKGAGRAFSRHRTEQGTLRRGQDLGADAATQREQAVVQLAELILSAVNTELPAVVVVEDIHLMGSDLSTFLEALAARRADKPVLVIATAWPEGDHQPVYREWRERAVAAGNLVEDQVPAMAGADLARFVRQIAPSTDQRSIRLLVSHFANPFALQLFLGLNSTRRRIARGGGALLVDEDTLRTLDNSIRGLYQQRFDELPAAVQQALSHAAATLPPHTVGTLPYSHRVVTDAAAAADFIDRAARDDHIRALSQARTPYGWSSAELPGVDRFREPVLDDIARGHQLDDADVAELREAAVNVLRADVDATRGAGFWAAEDISQGMYFTATWLVSLLPQARVQTAADATAVIVLARSAAAAQHHAFAANLLYDSGALDLLPAESDETLLVMALCANCLGGAGRVDLAVTVASTAAQAWQARYGPDHPDTLIARHDLAYWLGRAGRLAEATALMREVLQGWRGLLGAESAATAEVHQDLAQLLSAAGDLTGAIAELTAALEMSSGVSSPDAPGTLAVRRELARQHGLLGRPAEAAEQLTELMPDLVRVLGPEHPQTLRTRSELGFWLGESGQYSQALDALLEVQQALDAMVGPQHPQAIANRSEIGSLLWTMGHAAAAVDLLRDVLTNQVAVAGPDDPATLTVRNNLALALAEAGLLDEAVEQHREVLADRVRVLGSDHPDTLFSSYNLALSLKGVGRTAEGVAMMREVLVARERVLGAEHPETLRARASVAMGVGELGRPGEAAMLTRDVIDARQLILGADHPATLASRASLGHWLRVDGRLQEAAAVWQELLDDQTRVLGRDDPATVMTRTNLAGLNGS